MRPLIEGEVEMIEVKESDWKLFRKKLDTEPEKPTLGDGIDTVNVTVNDTVNVTVNCGAPALLELIKKNPGNRVDYYARRLGKTKRTVMRYLSTMSEQVEFRGAPKTGGYYCKED